MITVRLNYFLDFLLAILPGCLIAQPTAMNFERIFPASSVSCIYQDAIGYMWIGDESGLKKYDGNRLISYTHDPLNPHSISDNWITTICATDTYNLWVGTLLGGLNKFDTRTGRFISYQNNPADSSSLADDRVYSIAVSKDSGLWVGTHAGVCKFIPRNDSSGYFQRYTGTTGNGVLLPTLPVVAIHEDTEGIVWIGTLGAGLIQYNPAGNTVKVYRHVPGDPTSLSLDIVGYIYDDKAGHLWLGTAFWYTEMGGGLNCFDKNSEKFRVYRHNNQDPLSLSNDMVLWISGTADAGSSDLWIATYGGGLNYFDADNGRFTRYQNDPADEKSLPADLLQTIYLDRTGVIWVGTKTRGVVKYAPSSHKFYHIKAKTDLKKGLHHPVVLSFCESSESGLWIGTNGGGLDYWDRDKNEFSSYLFDPSDPSSLSNNFVFCIIEDRKDPAILWMGTNGGINRLDKRTKSFKHYKNDPNDIYSLEYDGVLSLLQEESGIIWVGTRRGSLNKFDPVTGRFDRYAPPGGERGSFDELIIMDMVQDRQGNLWLGTLNRGLYNFNCHTEEFTTYRTSPKNKYGLSFDGITSLWNAPDDKILIASSGGGVNVLDPRTGQFKAYTVADGLSSNYIVGVTGDAKGRIWVSTDKGLSCINLHTNFIRNFTIEDGLQSNLFIFFSSGQTRKGELLFGGVNGFNYFHPDSLIENIIPPKVVITDIKIHSGEKGSLSLKENIFDLVNTPLILTHDQNFFSIEFTALDYHAPGKNRFLYKLGGVDHDWINLGNRHEAYYTRIAPGDYLFQVKGSNNDGIWNEKVTSVRITILPPWWRSNLAYALYVFLVGAAIFMTWRFQLNRLRLKHQLELEHLEATKLQEVDHLKSRFFANISHEFRTPLTLILGPIKKWLSRSRNHDLKQDLQLMQRNANRLYRLINQLLDLSKLESGSMVLRAREENIVPLLRGYVQSFESQVKIKKINLTFSASQESIILYVDRDKIEKITYNLLSNAFKFTPEGGRIAVVIHTPPVSPLIYACQSGAARLGGGK